jgi:hypothetical protein
MTYLAQDLITRSWLLSGIVARNLQYPTGDQITDGLRMLNDLLNFKQIETDLIPYWQYITFNATSQQEYYFLPYVAEIESSTFNIGVVRYPMVSTTRRNYFGSSRVDNIYTLPFSWNYERGIGGGTLGMYFIPDQAYPIKLKAKITLTDVNLNTDLTYIFPPLGDNFTAIQNNTAFTVTSGVGGALVVNSQQSMSFGEEVQFIAGILGLPATLSPATIYYASPINAGSFNVATTLANAQSGTFVAYASGNGSVESFSLVITQDSPINIPVGQQIIFSQGSNGSLPSGLTEGVIYYANPSSPFTFTVATSLINAQSGVNIAFVNAGTGSNTISVLNPNNIPNYTYYTFINNANQGYDTAYIEMLRYALARYMCSEYGVQFNPESEKIYQSYIRKLMYMDPPDMSMKKVSILYADQQPGYTWADANLGHGYRP